MGRCLYCSSPLGTRSRGRGGRPVAEAPREAYDPQLGRLWDICPSCYRWNPVPLEIRWETLERLETQVRAKGRVILQSAHLALIRLDGNEVVRVGAPSLSEWGAWRYGTRLIAPVPKGNFLARALRSLPPSPLEGYDPYGLAGPIGGVGGKQGPAQWLASPFLDHARPLTAAFTSIPFAHECPGCRCPMPLQPWDFAGVSFFITSGVVGVEAACANCETRVPFSLAAVRPALRMGLAILDSDRPARALGQKAGTALQGAGGGRLFLEGLGRIGVLIGELDPVDRVGLGISLDLEAETDALDSEWSDAEEIASIMDGELTDVPGFREFRARVLGEEIPPLSIDGASGDS